MLAQLVGGAARRPRMVLVLVALVAALSAALALWRLEPSGAQDTLTDRDSPAFEATERYRERFGDHSIVILVRGELQNIVLTENLGKLLGLEGCLSGNQPEGAGRLLAWRGSPCAELARTKPVQVVYGPGTFINAAVGEIQQQLAALQQSKSQEAEEKAEAARKLARRQGRSAKQAEQFADSARQLVFAELARDLAQMAVRYGLALKVPRIDDPDFVQTLVFDATRGANQPKRRFAYLFPNGRSSVIQVRLKPGLDEAERRAAIGLVRRAVGMDQWRLDFEARYTVTGAPVVVAGLTQSITDAIWLLLLVAVLVMAAVLALVFRSRARLVPLGVALAATAIVFGAMALAGVELTMATIAVLPVLVGLGVDYAIQYQARVTEEGGDADRAARIGVPTIATAALATGAGFLVLALPVVGSPIPMVRGFALLLVLGIALALLLALTAGTAALHLQRMDRPPRDGAIARSARGANELLAGALAPLRRPGAAIARRASALASRTVALSLRRPGRVLAVAVLAAVAGWGLGLRAEVTSDLRQLVPNDIREVRDIDVLQDTTGVAGEIDVLVEGDDLTRPEVIEWMRKYQAELLETYGYSKDRGCGEAEICPALSLPDLFRTQAAAQDRQRIRALLDAVPPYFSQAVISADRKTANLAFGIKLMPFDEQQRVIETMRDALDPPEGVRAELAGVSVLAAQASSALQSEWRRLAQLLAGLLAVALVLLAAYRRPGRALVPLVPIALATGWSALVLWLTQVPLNPMSATLGALVIAISTEFSVLLSARFRQERHAGHQPAEALRRTYASTGTAVLASGATAIAGFAVLAASDIQMLRDFGIVTVIDLAVSLLGVLAVLPAVLVLAERRSSRGRAAAPTAAAASA